MVIVVAAAAANTFVLWPLFLPLGGLLLLLLAVSSWRRTGDARRAAMIGGAGLLILFMTVKGLEAIGLGALFCLALWVMLVRPFGR